ncbi:hypothetical protein TNCT_328541 [Trichonephila clavata]|uniref:Uncharacterized protein n=1 Tax=Trichonephila clavata TaxID=2740835 RepID=A0A8X6KTV8_TRICU|nr:hypothetical protein TNCT_328541 [Trichonephila clavata]
MSSSLSSGSTISPQQKTPTTKEKNKTQWASQFIKRGRGRDLKENEKALWRGEEDSRVLTLFHGECKVSSRRSETVGVTTCPKTNSWSTRVMNN